MSMKENVSFNSKTTGTLTPGAHAGSYNGQDAYNDLLVVDNGVLERATGSRFINGKKCRGGAEDA